ncbi:MAG TPA: PAS domain-containing protein [Polyangiaceae bacterium]|nr:PAS domain-containing protein [Polyangiaceae bacterium]
MSDVDLSAGSNVSQLAVTRRLASELARPRRDTDGPWFSSFDDVPLVCIVTDPRGRILDANRVAQLFLNVERGLLRRKPLLHFVARRDARRFRMRLQDLRQGPLEPMVVHLRSRKGAACPMVLLIEQVAGRTDLLWTAAPCG